MTAPAQLSLFGAPAPATPRRTWAEYRAQIERANDPARILAAHRATRRPPTAETIRAWQADGLEICQHCGRGIDRAGARWSSVVPAGNGGQVDPEHCDATNAEHQPATILEVAS